MVTYIHVKTGGEIALIRKLFLEYAESLDFDLDFQNFEEELRSLPGEYVPPKGCMILAMDQDDVAGCVAMRPLSPGICEMKRLYVKPQHRGKNIGRLMAAKIINDASKCGYERMRLDTVPSMKAAQKLYESMGFKQIPAYRHNPVSGTMYLELKISDFTHKGTQA